MNDKELQSRLNAELSNITWSARNGNAVRRRVNEGGTIMKRKHTFAFVLAMILVLACAATAIAAATSEEFNAWLYQLWPEAAMKLMPVELSCEDKGFRLEVTSASAEGSEILISYTVEDLERKNRLEGLEIYPQVVCYTSSAVEVNKGAEDYDKAAQKLYAAEYVKYTNDLIPPKSDVMTLWWQCFSHFENHDFELYSYFREYGDQVQTTSEIPGNVIVRQPAVKPDDMSFAESGLPETFRIIDTNSSLEIPLFENVYLSGIKMIDGWLHIQVHYVDHHMIHYDGGMYRPYDIWCTGEETYADDDYWDEHRVLMWGDETFKDGWNGVLQEWEEHVFPVNEELLEKSGSIPVLIQKNLGMINADFKVHIPLRLIRNAK